MKYLWLFILTFVFAVLQTTVIDAISIFGVIPNLLVTAVICYSLMRGDLRAIIFGAIIGIVLDFLSGKIVGMNLILCTLTAFLSASLYESLFNNNSFVAAVFVLWISFLYEFLIYVFYFLFWGESAFLFAVFKVVLPCAFYNALCTFFIYPIMRKISSLDRERE